MADVFKPLQGLNSLATASVPSTRLVDMGDNAFAELVVTQPVGASWEQFYILGHLPVLNNALQVVTDTGSTGQNPVVVPPAGGIQMRVVSSDANDASAGTGARTVRVHYLDSNYATQYEDITLNGNTPVNTTATNILRVQNFHVQSIGSYATAYGNITLTNTANTVTYALIGAGRNQCRHGIFTIPDGKKAFVHQFSVSAGAASGTHYTSVRLKATSHEGQLLPGLFLSKIDLGVLNGTATMDFDPPLEVPPRADIVAVAVSDSPSANVSVNVVIRGSMH